MLPFVGNPRMSDVICEAEQFSYCLQKKQTNNYLGLSIFEHLVDSSPCELHLYRAMEISVGPCTLLVSAELDGISVIPDPASRRPQLQVANHSGGISGARLSKLRRKASIPSFHRFVSRTTLLATAARHRRHLNRQRSV